MKKSSLLIAGISMSFFGVSAQSISSSSISSQGELSTGNAINLQWNLGEGIIETGSSNQVLFTQGFVQPRLKVLSFNPLNQSNLKLSGFVISPNPTQNLLNVFIPEENTSEIQFELYDANGGVISRTRIESMAKTVTLNLSGFPAGMYTLHILSLTGTLSETHRIIKI